MRTTKFWRQRESQIMKLLGLCPTPNSGSGELFKEDGQSETHIAQLKSTDAMQITLRFADVKALLANAARSHLLPLFVLDFVDRTQLVCLPIENYLELVKQHEQTVQNTRNCCLSCEHCSDNTKHKNTSHCVTRDAVKNS